MNDGKLTQFGIRKKENVLVHGIKISRHRTGLRYCDTLGPGSLHHPALIFFLCVASRSHPLREARVQRKEKSFFHGSERLGIESQVGSNWPRLDLRSSMHAKPCCHGGVVCGRARPGPRAPSPPPLIR